MSDLYKYIITFTGIFIKDVQQSLGIPIQKESLENISDDEDDDYDQIDNTLSWDITTEEAIKYEELPRRFVNVKDWPKKLNLLCWTCQNTCNKTIPIPIITSEKTDIKTNSDNTTSEYIYYETYGIFCTGLCMTYHLSRFLRDRYNYDMIYKLSHKIFNIIYETNITIIPECNDPYTQKCFSGPTGISSRDWLNSNIQSQEILLKSTNNWS